MAYKAALRAELSARCGVSWTAVDDNGIAEIEGVPEALCEAWSARRRAVKLAGDELVAIEEAERGRSLTSSERAACFQLAAYRTRTPKADADTTTTELKARWQEEAVGFGHDPDRWLPGALGHERAAVVAPGADELAEVLARLEERSATWTRADVVEECARLVTGADSADVLGRIEALADQVLADPEVASLAAPLPVEAPSFLRRADGMAEFERHGGRRFTTTGTLRREAGVLEAAAAGMDAGVGIVPGPGADAAIAGADLGDDQKKAVHGLLSGGEQVALLVGPAGAGKSRALFAARQAWEAAGYDVVGCAPSAMAASVLEEASGIASDTVAKALQRVASGEAVLSQRSVVVLDEAGMARTDDLARLVDAVREGGAKLVLVGDPHQLGAVGPGGLFRTLVEDHGAHELETVRRFTHAWEAAASLRLRSRDPAVLPAYVAHDRIAEGSRAAMADAALDGWRQGRGKGTDVLLMAGDNATADELSRRCRAERVAAGEVEADGARLASGTAGIGDEVVTLRNDRRLRAEGGDFIRNGARWQIVGRSDDGALSVVPLDGGEPVRLPASYVSEHVGLAYALTIHKAQGTTADKALVVVDEQMSAAQLYVAMSRGREENRALVVTDGHDPDDHVRPVGISGIEQLVQVLRRDGTEHSAHEVLRAGLARSEDRELLRRLAGALRERLEERVGADRRREIAELERHDDLPTAKEAMRAAEQRLEVAEIRRRAAEDRMAASATLRARLPGRRGRGARTDQLQAEGRLRDARREEHRALRDLEAGRHRLDRAERRHEALRDLRSEQARRDAFLAEHPEEADLAKALRGLWHRHDQPTPVARTERGYAAGRVDVGAATSDEGLPRGPVPGPRRRGPGIGR